MSITIDSKNINLEFSRVKLLGYYEHALNSLRPEIVYPDEAEALFGLLTKSFNSAECIKSIDSDMRETLLSTELI